MEVIIGKSFISSFHRCHSQLSLVHSSSPFLLGLTICLRLPLLFSDLGPFCKGPLNCPISHPILFGNFFWSFFFTAVYFPSGQCVLHMRLIKILNCNLHSRCSINACELRQWMRCGGKIQGHSHHWESKDWTIHISGAFLVSKALAFKEAAPKDQEAKASVFLPSS